MRRLLQALGCLVLLAVLAAGGAAWWAWSTIHRPYGTGEETVMIEPGTDAGTILTRLEARGVIPDALLARAWLVYVLDDPPLHAGEYRFEGASTTPEVLDKLARGDVVLHQVTVVEGLTLEETAAALAAAGFGELDAFLAAMGDPSPVADLDPEAETLEGFLFPETYAFTRGAGEEEIVEAMARTFRERFEEEVRPLLEGRPGLPPPRSLDSARDDKEVDSGRHRERFTTVRELVTLASIVEKEAKVEGERRQVAGVYANRLAAGIGLYADPTVIYALKRRGEWDGNLTREHLQLDSPYNTYRYGGLPPGPIASPGLGSLRAAADPADVPYLYFVSRNDGTHVFAETLAEHNENVRRWQKEYWRRRWAEERRQRDDGGAAPPGD